MCASAAFRRPPTIAALGTLIVMLNIQEPDTVVQYSTVKLDLPYHCLVQDLKVSIYRVLPIDGQNILRTCTHYLNYIPQRL